MENIMDEGEVKLERAQLCETSIAIARVLLEQSSSDEAWRSWLQSPAFHEAITREYNVAPHRLKGPDEFHI
jgi:hypothetical protein